ncbi:MAG: isopentenyl phosphate kinase [Candidatus Thermoplasmatota archaeon]|nr:isopentenyl phosphate kinase [Candidatus Thermoplasmatota archaeon]
MIIFKLGGSVITKKDEYRIPRMETLRNILRVVDKFQGKKIIVHGGGSFGHIKAKEFEIPGRVTPNTRKGYAVIHRDMTDLNQLVVSALIELGISAVGMSSATLGINGKVVYDHAQNLLSRGITPVLYGDVYTLRGGRFGIYSGDTIVHDMAIRYKPSKAIFFTDVDGIFDKDPKDNPDARLLKTVNLKPQFGLTRNDVTGGMEGKFSTIQKIRLHCKEVYLLNGNYPERILEKRRKSFIGTVIS